MLPLNFGMPRLPISFGCGFLLQSVLYLIAFGLEPLMSLRKVRVQNASLRSDDRKTYLTYLRQLELKLIGAILRVLQSLLQSLGTVVAVNLLLQFAYSPLVLLDLYPQIVKRTIQQLNLALLR